MTCSPLLRVYRLVEIDASVEQRISCVSPARGNGLVALALPRQGTSREAFPSLPDRYHQYFALPMQMQTHYARLLRSRATEGCEDKEPGQSHLKSARSKKFF